MTRLVRGYFNYKGIPLSLDDTENTGLEETPDKPLDNATEDDPFSVVLVRSDLF